MPILVGPAARLSRNVLESFTILEWVMLVAGSAACGVCAVWIGSLLGIPTEPGFSGSLLGSTAPVLGVLVAVLAMAAGVFVGSLFTASVQTDAGFFCACLGLAGLAIRSGPIRPVLQYANGNSIFLKMSVETAVLGVIIFGAWYVFTRFFSGTMLLRPANPATANELADAGIDKKLSAVGAQIVIMGILQLIIIQSDAIAQGLIGVGVAAYLSVLITYLYVIPLPESRWYWIGPSVLGVLGYLITYFNTGNLGTGETTGLLAPLARITPLAYVSAGTAGALLAYWCARRWSQPEVEDEEETLPVAH